MGMRQNNSVIIGINNQIRYYGDKIRYLELDIAEILEPYKNSGEDILKSDKDDIESKREKIKYYEALKEKEMKRLKNLR